jgi:hypothetical protein
MKRIMLFASALALAACSNGGSSNSNPAPGPGQLGNHPIANKTALTDSQKLTIKNFSAKLEKMPDSGLFLPPENESSSDRQQRYDKKNKLSPEGKLNFDKIQNNCQFQFPQTVGSDQSSTMTSSIGGQGCPINFNQTVKSDSVGQPGGKSSTFKSTTSANLAILDPAMASQVGFVKSTTNFSMSGSFTVGEQTYRSYMSGTGGVTLQTVSGQNASMSMAMEMASTESSSKSYTEVTMNLDSISATVQVFVESAQNQQASVKFFLNGQPTTEQELKSIFGDNFSVGNNQSENQN